MAGLGGSLLWLDLRRLLLVFVDMVSVVLLAMYLGVLLSSLSMCLRPLGLEVLPVQPLRVFPGSFSRSTWLSSP